MEKTGYITIDDIGCHLTSLYQKADDLKKPRERQQVVTLVNSSSGHLAKRANHSSSSASNAFFPNFFFIHCILSPKFSSSQYTFWFEWWDHYALSLWPWIYCFISLDLYFFTLKCKYGYISCHFLLQCMKVKSQSEVAPHGLQPTRLLRPWDFPGKGTGVGCHCLLPMKHSGRGLVCL